MGTIFSRVKLSGKHVAALLVLMLLSAVTAMLLPTALASMIDIGVAGESRSAILVIAAVMVALAILGCLFNMAATVLSARVSTKFAADLRREIFHQVQDLASCCVGFEKLPGDGQELAEAIRQGRFTREIFRGI